MNLKVAIGPSSFSEKSDEPEKMLKEAGLEIIPNPYSRRLTEEEIIKHIENADALIAGLEPLNRKVLYASKLKVIARVGIGVENVDFTAAKELGIKVSNTPDAPTYAVAELTVTALLALCRNIISANRSMHAGKWQKDISVSLKGLNILIIGYGRIGKKVRELIKPFRANFLIADPCVDADSSGECGTLVTLDEGLKKADIISLHASGKNVILGREEFEKMKDGVIILNSARGELIDENELINALEKRKVAGVWLDVFREEPYNGKLKNYDNVILTPHVGTYTKQCRLEMEVQAVKNLLRDLGLQNEN